MSMSLREGEVVDGEDEVESDRERVICRQLRRHAGDGFTERETKQTTSSSITFNPK